jgi:hypothetical protein
VQPPAPRNPTSTSTWSSTFPVTVADCIARLVAKLPDGAAATADLLRDVLPSCVARSHSHKLLSDVVAVVEQVEPAAEPVKQQRTAVVLPRNFEFRVHVACITYCTPPILAELVRDFGRFNLPQLPVRSSAMGDECAVLYTLAHIIGKQPSDVAVLEDMATVYEAAEANGATGYVKPCRKTLVMLAAIVKSVLAGSA